MALPPRVEYPVACYLLSRRKHPEWLAVSRLLGGHDCKDDTRGRHGYGSFLEEAALAERGHEARERPEYRAIRRGWCFGGEVFRDRLIELAGEAMRGKGRTSFEPAPVREVSQAAARKLIERALGILKLPEADLPHLKKTDERKMLIAWLLKTRTTVSNQWISKQLSMGHHANASNAARFVARNPERRLATQRKQIESLF